MRPSKSTDVICPGNAPQSTAERLQPCWNSSNRSSRDINNAMLSLSAPSGWHVLCFFLLSLQRSVIGFEEEVQGIPRSSAFGFFLQPLPTVAARPISVYVSVFQGLTVGYVIEERCKSRAKAPGSDKANSLARLNSLQYSVRSGS